MATALYRRYRPESFAEVIGQDHVTTPLRRALNAGRIGHAYLFSGPRGCGKTTSARILARCLNCAEGPTDTPCGQCASCVDLARGGAGSLDVVEIDAASHGGVDDARELRERASFAPVRDRFKIFIIDEAHMVTSAGFNALLKLVEEPPEHVKFVFATTEPDKVIGTIRSRTHHYPFRLIPPQVLGPYLHEVCAAEDVAVGDGVLPLVVRAGGGSARDSMSVLDQLMAGAGEHGLDFATAIALLGFTDTALLDRAVMAIAQRDAGQLYGAVEQVLTTGHEPRRFVEDLLERIRDLIVLAAVPDGGADLLPQVPADELSSMREQASQFAPADLSLCGDLVFETLSTMTGATSPRLHLELLAARLVLRDERAGAVTSTSAGGHRAERPATGAAAAAGAGRPAGGGAPAGGGREEARRIAQERAHAAKQARDGGAPSRPAAAVGSATQQAPAAPSGPEHGEPAQTPPAQNASTPSTTSWEPAATEHPAASVAESLPDGRGEAPAAPEPPARTSAPSAPVAPGGGAGDVAAGPSADEIRGHWSAILDELAQIRRPSWALISQNGHVHDLRGSTLLIGFRTEGLVAAFRRGTAAENLADAVRRITRLDVSVEAVVGEDPGPGGGSSGDGPRGGGLDGGGRPAAGGPAERWGGSANGADRGGHGSGSASSGGTGPRAAGPGWSATTMQAQDRDAAPGQPRPVSAAPSAESRVQASALTPAPGSAAARAAKRWGEAAAAATPTAAPRGDFPAEDFPPEPDDPYPPDPQDYPTPQADAPLAAPWERSNAPTDQASAAGAATPPGDPVSAEHDEIPVVQDEGRDSLPAGQPRTYGQAALRRAIAEGRVVHSRPAESAPGKPTTMAPVPGPAAPAVPASPAPQPTQAWADTDVPAPSPATSAVSSSRAAGGAAAAVAAPAAMPADEPTTPPRSGAALVREAAEASRSAGRRFGSARGASALSATSALPADEDPTGGASRDDADATVATRNGRELIESLLGGKVLEVIDETREY